MTGFTSSKKIATIIIVFMCVVSQFAIDCYIPSFPAIAKILQATESSVQFSITFFLLGSVPVQFIAGTLSDTFGRRPLYIIGITIFVIGCLFCLFASNIHLFLSGRLIQGVGIGCGFALAWACARDMFSGKAFTQFISVIGAITALIPISSPIVGGYIQHYLGWRYVFALLLVMGIILLISLLTLFPETLKNDHKRPLRLQNVCQSYKTLLTSRIFLTNGLSAPFASGAAIIYITITPFLYQHVLNLSPIVFSWVTALVAVGIAVGCIANAKLVEKFGENNLMKFGIGWMFAGILLMLIFALLNFLNLYAILLPMLLVTLSIGFIVPNASSRAMNPFKELAGSAAAMFSGMQMLIFSILSAIAASFHDQNQKPLAFLLLILPIIVTVLFYLSNKKSKS